MKRRIQFGGVTKWLAAVIFALSVQVGWAQPTNSFPEVNEVLQGKVFTSDFARNVFFLRQIRDRYQQYWRSLLAANISPGDYVVAPEKMERFVEEVGAADEGTDDAVACTNLGSIVNEPEYYTNAPQPALQSAVVTALMKLGPRGRQVLAATFSQTHYRIDPQSLEEVANLIGKSGTADSNFAAALAATAFTFTAINGGSYPRCTETAVTNLPGLTKGVETLRRHLNTNEMFNDPGRFQAVMDGIVEAQVGSLATNLNILDVAMETRLKTIAPGPDPYRDDLLELQKRVKKAIAVLKKE